eukprot:m.258510 g.258510  ORF g.258510 m.258510 type:complete len:74 (+) comp15969_c0_seq8:4120-4341(+)
MRCHVGDLATVPWKQNALTCINAVGDSVVSVVASNCPCWHKPTTKQHSSPSDHIDTPCASPFSSLSLRNVIVH